MTAQLRSGSIPAFCEQVTSGPKAARPMADTLVAQDHVAIGCVPSPGIPPTACVCADDCSSVLEAHCVAAQRDRRARSARRTVRKHQLTVDYAGEWVNGR